MGPRIIVICFLFGLFWLVPYFLLRPDGSSIAVTYNGSYPVPVEIDFDNDCMATWDNGQMKQKKGCDSFGSGGIGEPPKECNVTFAFLPIERRVSRLNAKFVMLKDGKELGRGSVSLSSLVYDAEEQKWAQASFRGRCGTEQLRLLEATAIVDGTATDLIASDMIRATGLIPWFPGGGDIEIAERQG
ncbi:MAG TPA: hypothetical protein VFZ07_11045 [Dongiaceae bacterium]